MRAYASGWFVRIKITNVHPIYNNNYIFKNVLRIFKAEILKLFENIEPQPKH